MNEDRLTVDKLRAMLALLSRQEQLPMFTEEEGLASLPPPELIAAEWDKLNE